MCESGKYICINISFFFIFPDFSLWTHIFFVHRLKSSIKTTTWNGLCNNTCPQNSGSVLGAKSIADCFWLAGYTEENDNICVSCVSGKYKLELGIQACVLCARGKYKTDPGPGSFDNTCPQNSDSELGANSTSNCLCVAGYTSLSDNLCSLCVSGKCKIAIGNHECSTWPQNSVSEPGTISTVECLCVAGYTTENNNLCVVFASGKYKSQEGNEPCVLCARGEYKTHPGPGSCNDICPQTVIQS